MDPEVLGPILAGIVLVVFIYFVSRSWKRSGEEFRAAKKRWKAEEEEERAKEADDRAKTLEKHRLSIKSKFSPNDSEKLHQEWPLTIQTASLDDGRIRISWMMAPQEGYTLLGFRKSGGFHHDPYDEDGNGLRIVHSTEEFNYTLDRPSDGAQLYYTFFLQHDDARRRAQARRAKQVGEATSNPVQANKNDTPKEEPRKKEEDSLFVNALAGIAMVGIREAHRSYEKGLHIGLIRFSVTPIPNQNEEIGRLISKTERDTREKIDRDEALNNLIYEREAHWDVKVRRGEIPIEEAERIFKREKMLILSRITND